MIYKFILVKKKEKYLFKYNNNYNNVYIYKKLNFFIQNKIIYN